MIARAAAGVLVAVTVALAARRAHALSGSGTAAAAVVGALAVAAGWAWGALLIAYFVASIALSRLRAGEKAERTGGIVAKGGARDAIQVVANGGLFAVAALSTALAARIGAAPGVVVILTAIALGALAAATADTWATEIGSLASTPPRSIVTGRPVPAGTSGGVNALGIGAMVVGAAFVLLGARLLSIDAPVAPVLAGGVCGALADSVIGATLQDRRWCDACAESTERFVHACGTTTRHAGGLAAMDNDLVNLLATLVGGAVAALMVLL